MHSSAKVLRDDGDHSVKIMRLAMVNSICHALMFSIRRAGYPIRHDFVQFVDRYRILWSEMTPEVVKGADAKTNSIKLAKHILGNRDWQVGVTKVFIKVRVSDNS